MVILERFHCASRSCAFPPVIKQGWVCLHEGYTIREHWKLHFHQMFRGAWGLNERLRGPSCFFGVKPEGSQMWLLQVPDVFVHLFICPAHQALRYFCGEMAVHVVRGSCIYQLYLCWRMCEKYVAFLSMLEKFVVMSTVWNGVPLT